MISPSIISRLKSQDGSEIECIDKWVWAYNYMLSRPKQKSEGPSIPVGSKTARLDRFTSLILTEYRVVPRWDP